MNNLLNEDSQVMLLICSNLAITSNDKDTVKPYTLAEWNKMGTKLVNSDFKSPKAFLHNSSDEWKEALRLTNEEVERLKRLLNNGPQLAFQLDKLNSSGIWITTRAESTYPTLLKERLKLKCPIFLYCSGSPTLFRTKGVGIVGSRAIDEKALDFTKVLSERCVSEGFTIVSGGAKGVDSVAQNVALQKNGTVISIVSDSLASKVRNKENREAIIRKQLLMVSPFHPNMTFKAYNAMDRNKYIYALSQLTVAVSSDYNKGGTWAGATENLTHKWVPLFVRKEEDIPKGNSELIEAGATPLLKQEILDKNESITTWLKKRTSNLDTENINEQISLEQIINPQSNKLYKKNKNAVVTDIIKEENAKFIDTKKVMENTEEEIINSARITAFEILKPYLLANLDKEKTIDELIDIFEVKKSQMQEWIEKLLSEHQVIKLGRPVRYVRS